MSSFKVSQIREIHNKHNYDLQIVEKLSGKINFISKKSFELQTTSNTLPLVSNDSPLKQNHRKEITRTPSTAPA
jgi:hypothetical protein